MPIVPFDSLSPEALRGVIEEFVSREGTDYGGPVADLEEKVAQVLRQLERGEALLSFDADTGTCTLLPAEKGEATDPRP